MARVAADLAVVEDSADLAAVDSDEVEASQRKVGE